LVDVIGAVRSGRSKEGKEAYSYAEVEMGGKRNPDNEASGSFGGI
jgi:hypothetical protein